MLHPLQIQPNILNYVNIAYNPISDYSWEFRFAYFSRSFLQIVSIHWKVNGPAGCLVEALDGAEVAPLLAKEKNWKNTQSTIPLVVGIGILQFIYLILRIGLDLHRVYHLEPICELSIS